MPSALVCICVCLCVWPWSALCTLTVLVCSGCNNKISNRMVCPKKHFLTAVAGGQSRNRVLRALLARLAASFSLGPRWRKGMATALWSLLLRHRAQSSLLHTASLLNRFAGSPARHHCHLCVRTVPTQDIKIGLWANRSSVKMCCSPTRPTSSVQIQASL